MKTTIFFTLLLCVFAFTACKKETAGNDNGSNGTATVRYQFNATLAGSYNFRGATDNISFGETINAASWSKTVVMQNSVGAQNATITAFPPADWFGTSNEADVTLKIFINDVEKASGTAHFIGIDRPAGLKVSTTY